MTENYKNILPPSYTNFPEMDLQGNIIARFKKIVSQYPDYRASKTKDKEISYRELDIQSEALAGHLLNNLGIRKEPIAMMYRHGNDYFVALFGILKVGKFYANLDQELTIERLRLILENLGSKVCLHDSWCEKKAQELKAFFPKLELINTELIELHTHTPLENVSILQDDIAYIVYTSGTTGPPQGVMVTHENVLHFTKNNTQYMHINPGDRSAQLCSLWTGASNLEIFPMLLNGASLFPISVNREGIIGFIRLIQEESITIFTCVPTLFRAVMSALRNDDVLSSVRMIRLGGERILRNDFELYKQHFSDWCLLRVVLGASEVSMYAHMFLYKDSIIESKVVPVGYPLDDLELLLLSDTHNEVAVGEYGEIAVRSKYLSLGYWNNPQLTKERFIEDKFDKKIRIYLTQDIGFFDNENKLHHVGRKDSRVKIFGKMVLINDIENELMEITDIIDAVVVPFTTENDDIQLAAFIVANNDDLDTTEIKRKLNTKFPYEVIPNKFKVLKEMPLQINNKVNRLKLKYIASKDKE